MRAVAIFACTLLLSGAAFAQNKYGPSMDPLGDRTHNEPDKSPPQKVEAPRATKVVVRKRTVRVTKTRTSAAPKATPSKKKAVIKKKLPAKKP
jgi:hypothetical protein